MNDLKANQKDGTKLIQTLSSSHGTQEGLQTEKIMEDKDGT